MFGLLFFALAACASLQTQAQTETKGSVLAIRVNDIDTTKTDDTTLVGYVFMEHYKSTSIDLSGKEHTFEMTEYIPTMDEVREAENLLNKKYRKIMPGEKVGINTYRRPPLDSYVRQYIFGVASDGKRYVWINAISIKETWLMDDIKKRIVHVRDGGNAFWRTLLNLDDGTMVSNVVNGEA